MATCKEHGVLVQKVDDMHTQMLDKFKVTYVFLGAIGTIMTAILVTLVLNLGSYNAIVVRLDHAEKQVYALQETIKTFFIPRQAKETLWKF